MYNLPSDPTGLALDTGHFDMPSTAMTLAEVGERLGVSLRQVQKLVDDGSLTAVNVGRGSERRGLRVLDEDFQGFLVRRRIAACKVLPLPEGRVVRAEPLPAKPNYAQRRAHRLTLKSS